MKRYVSLFEKTLEEKVKMDDVVEAIGNYGVLFKYSKEDLYNKVGRDIENLSMWINSALLDISDSNDPNAKALNSLDDFRVTESEKHGKFSIVYPMKAYKNKKLFALYNKIFEDSFKMI